MSTSCKVLLLVQVFQLLLVMDFVLFESKTCLNLSLT